MKEMFHVTDAENAESIKSDGLQAGIKDLVFLTTSKEEAEHIGEIYPTIEDSVVFKAEVQEHNLMDDPEPHGDLDSYAHHGSIPSYNVEVA